MTKFQNCPSERLQRRNIHLYCTSSRIHAFHGSHSTNRWQHPHQTQYINRTINSWFLRESFSNRTIISLRVNSMNIQSYPHRTKKSGINHTEYSNLGILQTSQTHSRQFSTNYGHLKGQNWQKWNTKPSKIQNCCPRKTSIHTIGVTATASPQSFLH